MRVKMVAIECVYTEEQIVEYLERIGFQSEREPTLKVLTDLVKRHLCTFPFGALNRIYFGKDVDSMDLHDIFDKLVRRGREGFCLEHNGLLEHILKRLGFQCHPTVARQFDHKKESKPMMMMEHWVLIVNIESTNYLVDVGYSNRAPATPIQLDASHASTHRTKPFGLGYVLENEQETDWRPLYAFSLQEYYPQDMDVINYYVCHAPRSIFYSHLLVTKFTQNGSIRLLDNVIAITDNLKKSCITLTTEKERRDAIKDYFGITLDPNIIERLPPRFGIPL